MRRWIAIIGGIMALALVAAPERAEAQGQAVVDFVLGAVTEPAEIAYDSVLERGDVVRMEPGTLLVLRYAFPDPNGAQHCDVFEFIHNKTLITVGASPLIWACASTISTTDMEALRADGKPFVEYVALIGDREAYEARVIAGEVSSDDDAERIGLSFGNSQGALDTFKRRLSFQNRGGGVVLGAAGSSGGGGAAPPRRADPAGPGARRTPLAHCAAEARRIAGRLSGEQLRDLCDGVDARAPTAPAKCYERLSSGRAELGGRWRTGGIIAVCAGTVSAGVTLSCVQAVVRQGGGQRRIIRDCAK